MKKLIAKLKRLFCRHDFDNEFVGRSFAGGFEYLMYARTCKKCGEKRGVVAKFGRYERAPYNCRCSINYGTESGKAED